MPRTGLDGQDAAITASVTQDNGPYDLTHVLSPQPDSTAYSCDESASGSAFSVRRLNFLADWSMLNGIASLLSSLALMCSVLAPGFAPSVLRTSPAATVRNLFPETVLSVAAPTAPMPAHVWFAASLI